MQEKCSTIEEALSTMHTIEELEVFTNYLRNGAGAKTATEADWQLIAKRKIAVQQGARAQ